MDTINSTFQSASAFHNDCESNAKSTIKTVSTAVTGAAIGSVFPFVIGKVKESVVEVKSEETGDNKPSVEWANDDISVATKVNDDMSFNEAFAAARAEVGAGGAFEWRGNVYGTFYAEEWHNMSPADKADYNSHFSWNNIDTSSVPEQITTPTANQNDIEIVSVDNTQPSTANDDAPDASTVEVVSAEPEIEILGVVHDMSSGSNIGGMTVDGQNVFLVDVDGDFAFDIMASDLNQNNIVDEGEVVDIHSQGISVDDFGGISEISENINGEDPLPDYMADNTYEI